MLELPGLTNSGDIEKDVDTIRRYLSRLVPTLEMELSEAKQDEYENTFNAVSQGLGGTNEHTTAGALVKHELRKDNPHGVTAEQLGLSFGKMISVQLHPSGAVILIGEKKGIQINIQEVVENVTDWTKHGGVAYHDLDMGSWAAKIPVLYYTGIMANGEDAGDVWAGSVKLSDSENMGTVRLYCETNITLQIDTVPGEEGEQVITGVTVVDGPMSAEKHVKLTVIGVGVFGYGN